MKNILTTFFEKLEDEGRLVHGPAFWNVRYKFKSICSDTHVAEYSKYTFVDGDMQIAHTRVKDFLSTLLETTALQGHRVGDVKLCLRSLEESETLQITGGVFRVSVRFAVIPFNAEVIDETI